MLPPKLPAAASGAPCTRHASVAFAVCGSLPQCRSPRAQLQIVDVPILLQATVLPELSVINVVLPIRFTVAELPSWRLTNVVFPIVFAVAERRASDSLMNVVLPTRFAVADVPSVRLTNVVPPMDWLVVETACPLQYALQLSSVTGYGFRGQGQRPRARHMWYHWQPRRLRRCARCNR